MKNPKSLYSRLALITSVTLVVGYFVVYAAWTSILDSEVAPNATITSTLMTKIKNNLEYLSGGLANFTFSSGNVGIGISPTAKLQVDWNTHTNQVCNQSGWNCLDFSKKMPGSIYFRAYQNSAQSLTNASWVIIKHAVENVDNSNSYDPSTGIFTVPVSGFYHFDANVEFANTSAWQVDVSIYSPQKGNLCNEAQDAATATVGSDRLSCSNSAYFNAGDTVYVRWYQESSTTTSGSDYNNFSGFLVSQ